MIIQRNKTFREHTKPLPEFSDIIMGINDLQLSPEMIAFLYPETLVTHSGIIPSISPGSDALGKPPAYTFLGKNQRSVCILVSYPDVVFMPGEQLIFLQKILGACKYSLDDIALINTYQQPPDLASLKNQFNPRIVFLWGSVFNIPGLPYPLTDLAVTSWQNITILPIAQTDLMSRENPEAQVQKRILWNTLQKIFNL